MGTPGAFESGSLSKKEDGQLTRQIPWLRVFVEGVVIVGSILLAFGIEAWWDGVQEREDEQEALVGLTADVSANLSMLDAISQAHREFNSLASRLATMTPAQFAAVPEDSVGFYVQSLWYYGTFDSRDATVDGLVASGRLGIISDPRLRDALVDWKQGVDDTVEEARDLRSSAELVFQRMGSLGGPWNVGPGDLPLPRADLAMVSGDSELMAHVRVKNFMALLYGRELGLLIQDADQLMKLIDANRR